MHKSYSLSSTVALPAENNNCAVQGDVQLSCWPALQRNQGTRILGGQTVNSQFRRQMDAGFLVLAKEMQHAGGDSDVCGPVTLVLVPPPHIWQSMCYPASCLGYLGNQQTPFGRNWQTLATYLATQSSQTYNIWIQMLVDALSASGECNVWMVRHEHRHALLAQMRFYNWAESLYCGITQLTW